MSGYVLGRYLGKWIVHIKEEHYRNDKDQSTCRECRFNRFFFYEISTSFLWLPPLLHWTKEKENHNNKINNVNEPMFSEKNKAKLIMAFVIAAGFVVVEAFSQLFQHLLKRRKYNAESENIELKNKITKEITYGQLKKDNKFKNIGNSLKIYQQIVVLEEEIKKDQNPESQSRRIEMLERIKKAFKEDQEKEEKIKKLTDTRK